MLKNIFLPVFIIVTLIYSGCSDKNNIPEEEHHHEAGNTVKLADSSVKLIGLETEVVSLKTFSLTTTIPAKVVVNQDHEALVGSLVQGRVKKVLVRTGDYVREGQELMYVEGLEIGEIKAGYISAKASLDFHKANFERQQKLNEQNIGSEKSLMESRAEYEKALAEFNAQDKKIHSVGLTDEELLDNSGNNQDEHTSGILAVKSPINGFIVERNVVVGQLIDQATNAFKIINTSSVWVDGQIYEHDLGRFSKNASAVFKPISYSNNLFTGKISYIGQTIDETTRTLTVRAEFENTSGKLKPQMYGEMQILAENESAAIVIPAESVVKIDNEDFVFVRTADSEFEKRPVRTGPLQNNMVEIIEGLKEKEEVVIKGSFYLKSELLKGEFGEDEH